MDFAIKNTNEGHGKAIRRQKGLTTIQVAWCLSLCCHLVVNKSTAAWQSECFIWLWVSNFEKDGQKNNGPRTHSNELSHQTNPFISQRVIRRSAIIVVGQNWNSQTAPSRIWGLFDSTWFMLKQTQKSL